MFVLDLITVKLHVNTYELEQQKPGGNSVGVVVSLADYQFSAV